MGICFGSGRVAAIHSFFLIMCVGTFWRGGDRSETWGVSVRGLITELIHLMQSCCAPFIKQDVFVFWRMGHGCMCVCVFLQKVFVWQTWCAENILRRTDAITFFTLLLHDDTEQHHHKGDQTSTILAAKLQKRQRSRKVPAKWTRLSTNWAVHQSPRHGNRRPQLLLKWGSVTDKAAHYITSLSSLWGEQSGMSK